MSSGGSGLADQGSSSPLGTAPMRSSGGRDVVSSPIAIGLRPAVTGDPLKKNVYSKTNVGSPQRKADFNNIMAGEVKPVLERTNSFGKFQSQMKTVEDFLQDTLDPLFLDPDSPTQQSSPTASGTPSSKSSTSASPKSSASASPMSTPITPIGSPMEHLNLVAMKYAQKTEFAIPSTVKDLGVDHKQLLLIFLLEHFCSTNPVDGRPRPQFSSVCKRLHALGLLDSIDFLSDVEGLHENYKHIFGSLTDNNSSLPALDVTSSLHMGIFGPSLQLLRNPLGELSVQASNNRFEREFKDLGRIGRGGFGSVHKAYSIIDGMVYAVKKIRIRANKDERLDDVHIRVMREVSSLARLDHSNVVRYYTAWLELHSDSHAHEQKLLKHESGSVDESVDDDTNAQEDSTLHSEKRPTRVQRSSVVFHEAHDSDDSDSDSSNSDSSSDSDSSDIVRSTQRPMARSCPAFNPLRAPYSAPSPAINTKPTNAPIIESPPSDKRSPVVVAAKPAVRKSALTESILRSPASLISGQTSPLSGTSSDNMFEKIAVAPRMNAEPTTSGLTLSGVAAAPFAHLNTPTTAQSSLSPTISAVKPLDDTSVASSTRPRSLSATMEPPSIPRSPITPTKKMSVALPTTPVQFKLPQRELKSAPPKSQVTPPLAQRAVTPKSALLSRFLASNDDSTDTHGTTASGWDAESENESELSSNHERGLVRVMPSAPSVSSLRAALDLDRPQHIVLYIQMAYAPRSLKEFMTNRPAIRFSENIRIFKQIVAGLSHVHSRGLVHRDLKPGNIFFSEDDTVKIGDFGLAKEESLPESEFDSTDDNTSAGPPSLTDAMSPVTPLTPVLARLTPPRVPSVFPYSNGKNSPNTVATTTSSRTQQHTTGVGTLIYAAPEQLSGTTYDAKVDIYSLGVIFVELFCKFSTAMERALTLENVRKGQLPASLAEYIPTPVSKDELLALVLRMLSVDPAQRPTTFEILSSPCMCYGDSEVESLERKLAEKDRIVENQSTQIAALQRELMELRARAQA